MTFSVACLACCPAAAFPLSDDNALTIRASGSAADRGLARDPFSVFGDGGAILAMSAASSIIPSTAGAGIWAGANTAYSDLGWGLSPLPFNASTPSRLEQVAVGVPDGGATVLLLGCALLVLFFLSRPSMARLFWPLSLSRAHPVRDGGRLRTRTADPLRVKQVL
jgi:hypothetical protein